MATLEARGINYGHLVARNGFVQMVAMCCMPRDRPMRGIARVPKSSPAERSVHGCAPWRSPLLK